MKNAFYDAVPVVDLTGLYSDNAKTKGTVRWLLGGLLVTVTAGVAITMKLADRIEALEKRLNNDETVG